MTEHPVSKRALRLLMGIVIELGAFVLAASQFPALALAHHTNATTRVGGGLPGSAGLMMTDVPRPSATLGLELQSGYFGRAFEGNGRYQDAELGSVAVTTLNLRAAFEAESATRLVAELPAGAVGTARPTEDTTWSFGLGDLRLQVDQQVASWRLSEALPWSLRLGGGLVLPTGLYEPETRLEVTDYAATPDGAIDVATYNAQASLGADTWSPFVLAALRGELTPRLAAFSSVSLLVPLTRTRDDLWWGPDAAGSAGVSLTVLTDRLRAVLSVDYLHHVQDEVPDPETMKRVRVGGRDELGLHGGAWFGFGRFVECFIDVRVPVWMRVGGVQLVETVSGNVGCSATLPLRSTQADSPVDRPAPRG